MKNLRIKKGTSNLTDGDFAIQCGNVITGLTGNTNYPSPTPALPLVQAKIDKFNLLCKQAKSSDKSPKITLARNLLRMDIDKDMSSYFGYANSRGFTDITILTSTGFPLAKLPDPVKDIAQCDGLVVLVGPGVGQCALKVNKAQGATDYLFQYSETLTPETANWESVPSSDTNVKISGLTPGARYTFRVCGVRGKEMGSWSAYVVRFMS